MATTEGTFTASITFVNHLTRSIDTRTHTGSYEAAMTWLQINRIEALENLLAASITPVTAPTDTDRILAVLEDQTRQHELDELAAIENTPAGTTYHRPFLGAPLAR